jgi:hypothetical protein
MHDANAAGAQAIGLSGPAADRLAFLSSPTSVKARNLRLGCE